MPSWKLSWVCAWLAVSAAASEYLELTMASKLVPSPVEFSVLLPDGYAETKEPFPLLLVLHGGGGSRDYLRQVRPWIEECWRNGSLPKVVAVTATSKARSFYMDFKDGSQKWETFFTTELLEQMRANYKVRRDRGGTLLFGISMGGQGGLRLAFKHPDKFGGVAAMEPGIDPVLRYQDLLPRHRFWRSEELMEAAYGKPVDAAYWEANNPATIAARDPARLRQAGLAIYIECGDQDAFGLDEATEFLHRILRDNKILHEYHLVRGADHVGRTIRPRSIEALGFLGRLLNPAPPDPAAEDLHRRLAPLKKNLR
jgi:S-formylglutathione hydrolase